MQDYEIAAKELREIVDAKGMTLLSTPLPCAYGERDQIPFVCHVVCAGRTYETRYSVGSAIPLQDPPTRILGMMAGREEIIRACRAHRPAIDDARIRLAVRRAYRPTVYEVVSALANDAATVDGVQSWADWAIDMGMDLSSADRIRSAETAYEQCCAAARYLHVVFGHAGQEALSGIARRL